MLTTKNTKSSVAYFSLCALCELCGAVFRRLCKADIFSYHKEHEGHKENVSRQLFQSFKPFKSLKSFKSLRTFGCLYRFARLSRLSRRLRPCALDLVPLTLRALRSALRVNLDLWGTLFIVWLQKGKAEQVTVCKTESTCSA